MLENCIAQPGFYGNPGTLPSTCPLNYYCPLGSVMMSPCPQNTISDMMSSDISDCIANIGYYGLAGLNATQCLPGTYSNIANMTTCKLCEEYLTSIYPYTSCSTCQDGTLHSKENSSKCLPCIEKGLWSSNGHSVCSACTIIKESALKTADEKIYNPYSIVNGYYVHSFTKKEENTIFFSTDTLADILIIGGGGSGGENNGGGGGAGNVIFYDSFLFEKNIEYTLKVGNGGYDSDGEDSWIQTQDILILARGGKKGVSNLNCLNNSSNFQFSSNGKVCLKCPEDDSLSSNSIFGNILKYKRQNKGGCILRNMTSGEYSGEGGESFYLDPYENENVKYENTGQNGIYKHTWFETSKTFQDMFGELYESISILESDLNFYIAGGGGGSCQSANTDPACNMGGKGGGGIGSYMIGDCQNDGIKDAKNNTGSGGGSGCSNSKGGRGGSGAILIRYSRCQLCQPGKFFINLGKTITCKSCEIGKYSWWGFSECLICPPNSFSHEGASKCNGAHGFYIPQDVIMKTIHTSTSSVYVSNDIIISFNPLYNIWGIEGKISVQIVPNQGLILMLPTGPSITSNQTTLKIIEKNFRPCSYSFCTSEEVRGHCNPYGHQVCCQPGTYFRDGIDTECQVCPPHQFSIYGSETSCTDCIQGCHHQVIETCSPTSDTVCACNQGFFLASQTSQYQECIECPLNTTSKQNNTGKGMQSCLCKDPLSCSRKLRLRLIFVIDMRIQEFRSAAQNMLLETISHESEVCRDAISIKSVQEILTSDPDTHHINVSISIDNLENFPMKSEEYIYYNPKPSLPSINSRKPQTLILSWRWLPDHLFIVK